MLDFIDKFEIEEQHLDCLKLDEICSNSKNSRQNIIDPQSSYLYYYVEQPNCHIMVSKDVTCPLFDLRQINRFIIGSQLTDYLTPYCLNISCHVILDVQ